MIASLGEVILAAEIRQQRGRHVLMHCRNGHHHICPGCACECHSGLEHDANQVAALRRANHDNSIAQEDLDDEVDLD